MEGFKAWKDQTSGGASDRAIATRMQTNSTRIARHLNEAQPPIAETVIEFARAYGANPVLGLIAAGHLSLDDAAQAVVADDLRCASTMQLLTELLRREADATG
ncbi:hypothetical protein [Nocardia sp. NPDC051832]|uniref:hypothetical protein n=1 Tax=Nocardia sp. NPDC051832 TaxID=3155673 RepID=UPI00343C5B4E